MQNVEKIDITWARRHLIGFAKMQDNALAVKASEAEYAKLKNVGEKPVTADCGRALHPLSPFRIAQCGSHIEQSSVCGVGELTVEGLGDELLDAPQ